MNPFANMPDKTVSKTVSEAHVKVMKNSGALGRILFKATEIYRIFLTSELSSQTVSIRG